MAQLIKAVIDTQKNSYRSIGQVNAADDLELELEVKMNGQPIEFINPECELLIKKSDNNKVRQTKDIIYKDGKFKIKVDEQGVTYPGIVTCQLLTREDGRVSTCLFYFMVGASLDREILQSISKVEVLEQLDEYIAIAFANLEEYEKRILSSDETIRKLNDDMNEAEKIRGASELERQETFKDLKENMNATISNLESSINLSNLNEKERSEVFNSLKSDLESIKQDLNTLNTNITLEEGKRVQAEINRVNKALEIIEKLESTNNSVATAEAERVTVFNDIKSELTSLKEALTTINNTANSNEEVRKENEVGRVAAEQQRQDNFNSMKLENDNFKKGINEQYEDIATEFDKVIANVTNGNESATNSEIVQARGKEVNLNARLDNFDEQLDNIETEKISKNESNVITEEMCSQSLREKFTGGSVAVVGNGSVDVNNLASNLQEDVSNYTLTPLTIIDGTHYRDVDGIATVNTSAATYYSAIINCNSGDVFKINTRTQSKNQIGALFVDNDMNIKGKFLIGTGNLEIIENYKVVAPTLSTKLIVSVFSDKSFLKLSKLSYLGIANKIYVDEKFKGKETKYFNWEMNGIGVSGANNTTVTRIRTVDYYNFDGNILITPDTGYKYAVFSYDGNKNFIGYDWYEETKEININKNYFYRFCIANTNDTTANLSYKDKVKIEGFYQLPSLNVLINGRKPNRWYGKKLIIIGDSISDDNYNSALSFTYTKGIRDYFGFGSYENYAIASSTIAVKESKPEDRTPLVTRYQEMSDDGDLIIVSAITNDWFYQWTPIGTMESRDIYTLYGALHTLCLGLKKKYKGKTIKFLTGIMRRQNDRQTPHATNGLGKSLVYYNNIVKEVCGYYSIPVIDMFENCGLYPFDDELALEYYNQQGSEGNYYYTHPNSNGQEMMFNEIINHI